MPFGPDEIRERIEAIFRAAAEEHDIELLHEHLEESKQLHGESLSHIEALEAEIGRLKMTLLAIENQGLGVEEAFLGVDVRLQSAEAVGEDLRPAINMLWRSENWESR